MTGRPKRYPNGRPRTAKEMRDVDDESLSTTMLDERKAILKGSQAFAMAMLTSPEGYNARVRFIKQGSDGKTAHPRYVPHVNHTPPIRSNFEG